ncbi:hypothetical protein RSOL_326460 [Rhizoctonia solani AG-3 Rhs1AP]|uniref:Uncharacterized protein n=1 Tax=Rhizoctonia solani AG-3 Rhs1AP TaxID=1086054 RepID=A0A0A1UMC9_9AGAM|nr:hypothetical protein RSOL_326460 [Rhizoctonia solani AG-3 Rhs1AP]
MNNLVPSYWGRPLEHYLSDYMLWGAVTVDSLMSSDNLTMIDEFRDNIDRVSAIASGDPDMSNQVSVSTLRSLHRMPYKPETYVHMANPPLISGCIKLMASIRGSGKPSPFSYELGYLSFRLVEICLGACLLDNHRVLAFKTRSPLCKPNLVPPVVEELSTHAGGGGRESYNCVLGWSFCPDHATADYPLIISLSDTRLLMELLYSDRKLFLEAMRATHAIAGNLSALVFLFWRYVNYQRLLQGQLLSKKLRIPMLEIFYRCWVVSSTDQHAAFSHMYLCDKDQWPPWNELLHKVDPEDSRELVRAFTGHFVAANKFTFSDPITVSVLDIPNALYFLAYRIVPESEDLVGAFVETMIQRLWCAIADREESNELLIDSISTSLVWLRTILQQFHNTWETNTMPLSNIVLAMVNSELLPLVGRAMLLLEPFQSLDRQTPDLVKRSKIMAASRLLFEGISQVVPRDFLEMAFLHTLPVYWQVSRQMEFMSLVVFPEDIYPRRVRRGFYTVCVEIWNALCHSIADSQSRQGQGGVCANPRCPSPWDSGRNGVCVFALLGNILLYASMSSNHD